MFVLYLMTYAITIRVLDPLSPNSSHSQTIKHHLKAIATKTLPLEINLPFRKLHKFFCKGR
jgi:hypothetical protein